MDKSYYKYFSTFLASLVGMDLAIELPHHLPGLGRLQEVERLSDEQVRYPSIPPRTCSHLIR